MKKKDKESLRGKNSGELLKLLAEKRQEAAKAQAQAKGGTEKNLKKVWNLRREIAVVATLITEKNLMEKEKEVEAVSSEEKVK